MNQSNPATPAQAATPGNSEPTPQAPSQGAAPAGQAPQSGSEAQVSIPADEYRQLQRDKARLQSLQRQQGRKPQPAAADDNLDPNDPRAQELATARREADEAKAKLFRSELRDKTRELLEKPEFKKLPPSTKDLILKNPAAFTEATDIDNAAYELEDFLREQAATIVEAPAQAAAPGQPAQAQPQGHETPPAAARTAPTAPQPAQLEDVTNLRGPARSQAIIRNKMRAAANRQQPVQQ